MDARTPAPDARTPAPDARTLDDAAISDSAAPDARAPVPEDAATSEPATLTELTETLFGPGCILGRCHTTLAPAGGLSFTGQRLSVYEALVGVPSPQAPDRIRVVPGEPDQSYLIQKMTMDPPPYGQRMPPNGLLPDEYVERVRSWILAGAPDN